MKSKSGSLIYMFCETKELIVKKYTMYLVIKQDQKRDIANTGITMITPKVDGSW